MKVNREEAGIIFDAVDIVCMNCVEDTLNDHNICDACPVRKLCNSLEFTDAD